MRERHSEMFSAIINACHVLKFAPCFARLKSRTSRWYVFDYYVVVVVVVAAAAAVARHLQFPFHPRWCLCASRWEQARRFGYAPLVDLSATNAAATRRGLAMADLRRHQASAGTPWEDQCQLCIVNICRCFSNSAASVRCPEPKMMTEILWTNTIEK